MVTDIATVTWSPHGHPEAVDALLHLSQVMLVDSVNEFDARSAVHRARELAGDAYVVDLAWLRSTPWRERVAPRARPAAVARGAGADQLGDGAPPPGVDGGRAAVLRLAGGAARVGAGRW